MSYHQGFLYLSNAYGNAVEIINEARTAANLRTAINAGVKRFGDVLTEAGCDALAYAPCTMAADGSVTSWSVLSTAISAAPWYSASVPASAEAYGFYIEEWTGLDGAHHGREITSYGRNGASFGVQTSAHRTMALNVVLVGSSDRGLNHLFRWLESTLLGCCDPCNKPSMWIREYCTESADLTDGVARADGVALLSGPTWESPPVEDAGCFLRRVSFTLGAESPCFFREPVAGTTGTALKSAFTATVDALEAPIGRFVGTSLRQAVAMPVPPYGMVSPRITISSPLQFRTGGLSKRVLPQLRIVGLANPAGASLSDPGRMYPIGCILTSEYTLEAGQELVIDVGAQTVNVRAPHTSLEWTNGDSAIFVPPTADFIPVSGFEYPTFGSSSDRYKRWFGFDNCIAGVVVVEPNATPNTAWVTDMLVSQWTVTIESVVRFGCC